MSQSPEPAHLPVALKEHRDRTITALCQHFANDRLTVEEFEQRLDVANRAGAVSDLDALLSDLPATTSPAPAAMPFAAAPTSHIRDQQTLVAIMGGVERKGRWQPARSTLVVAVMGGAELDFREVQLPPGETEITLICVMGGAELIVRPDMNIDTGGFAIMGGFASRHDVQPGHDPNAPVLKINGFALMGGVDLQVRLPGETGRDARHRQRDERRRLRDENRRK